MLPQLADETMASTDFEINPTSFTFDPMAGIMLGTILVKVVCGDDNVWGYSCRVMDLTKHIARSVVLCLHLGRHGGEKFEKSSIAPTAKGVKEKLGRSSSLR